MNKKDAISENKMINISTTEVCQYKGFFGIVEEKFYPQHTNESTGKNSGIFSLCSLKLDFRENEVNFFPNSCYFFQFL